MARSSTCFQLLKTKLNAEGSQSRNDCTYNMFTSEMFSTAYEHKFKIKSLLTWWVIFSLAFSFSLNNQSHLILKNTIRQRQQDPTTRAAPVWECSCRKNEGGRSVLFKWRHRWKVGQWSSVLPLARGRFDIYWKTCWLFFKGLNKILRKGLITSFISETV